MDIAAFAEYCCEQSVHARKTDEFVVVDFWSEDESPEWEEGEGRMASLMPLRAELMRGDLRCLYLGWLHGVQNGECDDDQGEATVPPGLSKLSAALEAFVDFLRIDRDLIGVAAKLSAPEEEGPSRAQFLAWIKRMSEEEKNALLLEAACSDNPHFRADLLRQFQQHGRPPGSKSVSEEHRRSVGELLAAAETLAAERARIKAEREAAERARREQEQAATRARYLDVLAKREPAVWRQINDFIQTKRPNDYAQAVTLLVDLRDLTSRQGREQEFKAALNQLRQQHSAKPSFLRRLTESHL